MGNRNNHGFNGLQSIDLCKVDSIFVSDIGWRSEWIVNLDRRTERTQFMYDINYPRIPDIRNVFLKG